jgi:hypothetical protein
MSTEILLSEDYYEDFDLFNENFGDFIEDDDFEDKVLLKMCREQEKTAPLDLDALEDY